MCQWLRIFPLVTILVVVNVSCSSAPDGVSRWAPPGIADKGMVTMVEVGSLTCKPCRLMMPIVDAVKKEYGGRVAVKFIDVKKYPAKAEGLQIMTIPTQLIYDRNGRELLRHIGFFPKNELKAELERALGAE